MRSYATRFALHDWRKSGQKQATRHEDRIQAHRRGWRYQEGSHSQIFRNPRTKKGAAHLMISRVSCDKTAAWRLTKSADPIRSFFTVLPKWVGTINPTVETKTIHEEGGWMQRLGEGRNPAIGWTEFWSERGKAGFKTTIGKRGETHW